MKYLIALSLIGLLTGCDGDGRAYIKYSTEVEDCIVKYVYNPNGANFFIAKCPSKSTTITHSEQSGKTSKVVPSITENK